jgi:hypothetical protein
VRLTGEKEKLIHPLHGGGKPVAAIARIARLVGLTRKSRTAPGGPGLKKAARDQPYFLANHSLTLSFTTGALQNPLQTSRS